MQDVITFILRMFTSCFYTLVFLGVLAVVSFIVWAAEVRRGRWIPCSERLPGEEKEVLVYVKGDFDNSIPFITTAYINTDCDWNSDYDGEVIDSKITHWMPLPGPPESEVQRDDN